MSVRLVLAWKEGGVVARWQDVVDSAPDFATEVRLIFDAHKQDHRHATTGWLAAPERNRV